MIMILIDEIFLLYLHSKEMVTTSSTLAKCYWIVMSDIEFELDIPSLANKRIIMYYSAFIHVKELDSSSMID